MLASWGLFGLVGGAPGPLCPRSEVLNMPSSRSRLPAPAPPPRPGTDCSANSTARGGAYIATFEHGTPHPMPLPFRRVFASGAQPPCFGFSQAKERLNSMPPPSYSG
ncbi:hypothetical protein B0H11DRAFT_1918296 [Mycena galericulata]|nr:hypothetical protein B0H11DRAFT_1918296 [Mycena galericulata]